MNNEMAYSVVLSAVSVMVCGTVVLTEISADCTINTPLPPPDGNNVSRMTRLFAISAATSLVDRFKFGVSLDG
jgi:hypothetical protein